MLYPFYNWYNIDDSQIDCGKIITVNCDWLHTYTNICDLINACVWQIPKQLTKQCIVDFFNTTIDTIPATYYLRVSANGCIEAVAFPDFTTEDVKFKATSSDWTAWYWNQKIVWDITSSIYKTYIDVIWPANNQQLSIRIEWPKVDNITDIWVPDCEWAFVKAHLNWEFYYDCEWNWDNALWAVRYTTNDIVINEWTNAYKSYVFWLPNISRPSQPIVPGKWSMSIGQWNPEMLSIANRIKITKTWMYWIRMKWEAYINMWVSRIRLFVIQQNTAKWTNKLLIDSKYWNEDMPWMNIDALHIPLHYYEWATFKNAPAKTVTLTWWQLFKLEAWDILTLWCKIDWRDTDSIKPLVRRRDTVYDLKDQIVWEWISEIENSWPWLSYGVNRVSPYVY